MPISSALDIDAAATTEFPGEFRTGTLRRRALHAIGAIGVLGLVVLLAPGLGEMRDRLATASPTWLALAVLLEAASFGSYVVMFGPVFCTGLSWRRCWQIGGSQLAMGSLVPASGAGGLALGAWVLNRGGMDGERIARRSVAFFLIKSSVNFIAVAVLGTLLAVGLLGPELSLWLTAAPAAAATLALISVAAIPRLGPGAPADSGSSRLRRAVSATRRAATDGSAEALQLLRSGNRRVLAGSLGYWAFDNAVLWATFKAFGFSPAITIILMAYLIGQLGGLLPIPGGIGGIDAGLIGTLVVYGVPAMGAAAAVLAYRVILFWLPLAAGGFAFAGLRRQMPGELEFASCASAISAQTVALTPGGGAPAGERICTHVDDLAVIEPPQEIPGCADCLKTGDSWIHLRMCQTCGHIGCCDSSPNRHASAHHHATGHPVMRSVEPGEKWFYCYPDDATFVIAHSDDATFVIAH